MESLQDDLWQRVQWYEISRALVLRSSKVTWTSPKQQMPESSKQFEHDAKTLGFSCSTVQDRTHESKKDYEEAKKLCQRLYQESGQAHHTIATRPTICLARRRFGARRPKDWLEVVRHSANTKLFFLRMATVCVVAVFFMVTDIKVV